jgi:O-antigen ligase
MLKSILVYTDVRVHNIYILMVGQAGLIGGILFALFLLTTLGDLRHCLKHNSTTPIIVDIYSYGLFAGMLNIVFVILWHVIFFSHYILPLFFVMVGIASSLRCNLNNEQKEKYVLET